MALVRESTPDQLGLGEFLWTHDAVAHGCWCRRPSPVVHGWRAWECRTRSRSCLDYVNQGVRASACAHADERAVPTTIQCQGLHGEVALSVQRHGDPANPRMDRGRAAWLARVAQRNWAAHARRNRPAPAMVAAQRFDHPPITDRSRGQRLVHPSITRHSVAPQG
jgi:hypothetical protein